jgi:hypothetical protein
MTYAVPSNDQQGHETTKALELYFFISYLWLLQTQSI